MSFHRGCFCHRRSKGCACMSPMETQFIRLACVIDQIASNCKDQLSTFSLVMNTLLLVGDSTVVLMQSCFSPPPAVAAIKLSGCCSFCLYLYMLCSPVIRCFFTKAQRREQNFTSITSVIRFFVDKSTKMTIRFCIFVFMRVDIICSVLCTLHIKLQ